MRYFIVLLLLFSNALYAQLSPGKLSNAHKDLEGLKKCSKCHSRKEQVSRDKCLSCHTLLKQRISQGKGLHANADYSECQKCHIEHHGRDYALVWWRDGRDNFDHQLAGFELLGKHREQKCQKCHTAKNIADPAPLKKQKKDLNRTFLGLSPECLSCHHDEHRGQVKASCLSCHTMDGWKPAARFDHNKTKFNLIGRHQAVDCSRCHARIVDNAFPDDDSYLKFGGVRHENCVDCHKDIHNDKFGRRCETCHTPFGWRPIKGDKFNHDMTQFPLKGKHAAVTCEKCHPPGRSIKIARFKQCADCHANAHFGQMAEEKARRCENCHTQNGFSPSLFTIEQHAGTDFALRGGHLATPCISCHKPVAASNGRQTLRFRFSTTTCESCHKDPHGGQVDAYISKGGCQSCHTEQAWHTLKFDHKKTKFPLQGRHAVQACGACHKTKDKKQYVFKNMSTACQSCHKDIHYGQFASEKSKKLKKPFTDCSRCHTPTDWLAEKFDHNRDARFKLDGRHQFLKCEKCHKKLTVRTITVTQYRPMKRECKDCHGSSKVKK